MPAASSKTDQPPRSSPIRSTLTPEPSLLRRRASTARPSRAKLQMIFQNPQSSLDPRLTIARTLMRPLEAFGRGDGRTARRMRAGDLLEIVGLPKSFLDRYPHELSGGQRQRVGIARAI